MFDRLVQRRVRKKAAKGQAPQSGLAPISLLVVDLARAELTNELSHPSYRARFEETLRERLGADLLGYDLIAFCEWRASPAKLQLHFLMSEAALRPSVGEELFGDQRNPFDYTPGEVLRALARVILRRSSTTSRAISGETPSRSRSASRT